MNTLKYYFIRQNTKNRYPFTFYAGIMIQALRPVEDNQAFHCGVNKLHLVLYSGQGGELALSLSSREGCLKVWHYRIYPAFVLEGVSACFRLLYSISYSQCKRKVRVSVCMCVYMWIKVNLAKRSEESLVFNLNN